MNRKLCLVISAAIGVLSLSACAQKAERLDPLDGGRPYEAGSESTGGLKTLPAPSSLLERLSAFTPAEGLRAGSDYDQALPSNLVSISGDSALFEPNYQNGSGFSDTAYAIYLFNLPGYDGSAGSLGLSWADAPAAGQLFIGFADFANDQWDWQGMGNPDLLELSSLNNWIEPGTDSLLLAVAITGMDTSQLDSLQMAENWGPTAVLTADQQSGPAPLTVNFDASASDDGGDPADSIVLYEWDFESDGTVDQSGSSPLASHSYAGGAYTAVVRISDEQGLTATASVNIAAALRVSPTLVTDLIEHASSANLAQVAGKPAICYKCDPTGDGNYNAGLAYRRALDANGVAWGEPVILASDPQLQPGASNFLMIDGKPALAFRGRISGITGVYFLRANDAEGASWPAPQLIPGMPGGAVLKLLLIDGRPAIASTSQPSEFSYVSAQDALGQSWNTGASHSLSIPHLSLEDFSPQEINGWPAATLLVGSVTDPPTDSKFGLYYLRAQDIDGSAWDAPLALDVSDQYNVDTYPTLVVQGGKPAVVYATYSSTTVEDVRCIVAEDSNGAAWGSPQVQSELSSQHFLFPRSDGSLVAFGLMGQSQDSQVTFWAKTSSDPGLASWSTIGERMEENNPWPSNYLKCGEVNGGWGLVCSVPGSGIFYRHVLLDAE